MMNNVISNSATREQHFKYTKHEKSTGKFSELSVQSYGLKDEIGEIGEGKLANWQRTADLNLPRQDRVKKWLRSQGSHLTRKEL
jgi:hypothetical protein